MFNIGDTYWLKVKGVESDRIFSIKCKVLDENSHMIKAEVSHGDGNPVTVEIIPFARILDVQKIG